MQQARGSLGCSEPTTTKHQDDDDWYGFFSFPSTKDQPGVGRGFKTRVPPCLFATSLPVVWYAPQGMDVTRLGVQRPKRHTAKGTRVSLGTPAREFWSFWRAAKRGRFLPVFSRLGIAGLNQGQKPVVAARSDILPFARGECTFLRAPLFLAGFRNQKEKPGAPFPRILL